MHLTNQCYAHLHIHICWVDVNPVFTYLLAAYDKLHIHLCSLQEYFFLLICISNVSSLILCQFMTLHSTYVYSTLCQLSNFHFLYSCQNCSQSFMYIFIYIFRFMLKPIQLQTLHRLFTRTKITYCLIPNPVVNVCMVYAIMYHNVMQS